MTDCPNCAGTGKDPVALALGAVVPLSCWHCRGTGSVPDPSPARKAHPMTTEHPYVVTVRLTETTTRVVVRTFSVNPDSKANDIEASAAYWAKNVGNEAATSGRVEVLLADGIEGGAYSGLFEFEPGPDEPRHRLSDVPGFYS